MDPLFVLLVVLAVVLGYLFANVKYSFKSNRELYDQVVESLKKQRGLCKDVVLPEQEYEKSNVVCYNRERRKSVSLQYKSMRVYRATWRLVEFVMRDFIEMWYKNVSADPDFPNDVREMLEKVISVFSERCVLVDWPQFVSHKVLLTLRDMLRIFRIVETKVRGSNPDYDGKTESEKEQVLLVELSRSFVLHAASHSESAYLRRLSTIFLSQILPPLAFKVPVIRSLMREIFTNCIFGPSMGFCVPYHINRAIRALIADPNKEISFKTDELTEDSLDLNSSKYDSNNSVKNSPQKEESFMFRFVPIHIAKWLKIRPENTPRKNGIFKAGNKNTNNELKKLCDDDLKTPKISRLSVFSNCSSLKSRSVSRSIRKSTLAKYINTTPALSTNSLSPNADVNSSLKRALESRRASFLSKKIEDWAGERRIRNDLSALAQPHEISPNSSKLTPESNKFRSASTLANTPYTPNEILDIASLDNKERWQKLKMVDENENFSDVVPCESKIMLKNWSVSIVGAVTDFDPKPFVKYHIRVVHGRESWNICRRYNHFVDFNESLESFAEKYKDDTSESILIGELPPKKLWGNLSEAFIEQRKSELHQYLQTLVMQRPVVESDIWSEFFAKDDLEGTIFKDDRTTLSRKSTMSNLSEISKVPQDIKQKSREFSISNLIANSIMDPDSSLLAPSIPIPIPTASALSTPDATPVLARAATAPVEKVVSLDTPTPIVGSKTPLLHSKKSSTTSIDPELKLKDKNNKFKTKEFNLPTGKSSNTAKTYRASTSNLTLPLYDLLDEVFELHEHGWLRKQMTWMLTQVIEMSFDGVINDFLHSKVMEFTDEEQVASIIDKITDILWPEGTWGIKRGVTIPQETIDACRAEAKEKLISFVMNQSYVKGMLGADYVEKGVNRLWQFLQMEPLVKHLAYTILDSVMVVLFPDLENSIGRLRTDLMNPSDLRRESEPVRSKSSDVSKVEIKKEDSKSWLDSISESFLPSQASTSEEVETRQATSHSFSFLGLFGMSESNTDSKSTEPKSSFLSSINNLNPFSDSPPKKAKSVFIESTAELEKKKNTHVRSTMFFHR